MATIKAAVFMLSALALLLVHTEVHASRNFPQIQGMKFERNSVARQEYQQDKQEETHAKMFKSVLAQYQLHTHRVPDENVKSQIAKALRVHAYSMAHPLAVTEGNMKMQAAPLRNLPLSTMATLPNSVKDGATSNKMGCDMMNQLATTTDPNDKLLSNNVNNDSAAHNIADINTQTGSVVDPSENCINSSSSSNSQMFAQIAIPGSGSVKFCVYLPLPTSNGDAQTSEIDDNDYDYP